MGVKEALAGDQLLLNVRFLDRLADRSMADLGRKLTLTIVLSSGCCLLWAL